MVTLQVLKDIVTAGICSFSLSVTTSHHLGAGPGAISVLKPDLSKMRLDGSVLH